VPTYEYECGKCGHAFELFQQMSAPLKRKCPECGKLSLKRLIGTGSGVIFKGGGFYETDYRSDSYKKAADADKKAAEPKKTDIKDAKKTEAGKKTASGSKKSTGKGDSGSSGGTKKSSD
jgi:putative FmdB family regulatory protein